MTQASKQQLTDSLKIRPCSYNPSEQLELVTNPDGSMVIILPLSCKRLWFFTYCQENGKQGKTQVEHSEVTVNNGLGFITSKASVYIDDVMIADGAAGLAVDLNNMADMSNCIQSVTGMALSKALSNAGFGTVDRFYVDQIPIPCGDSNAAHNAPLPFTYQETPAPIQQGTPCTNAAPPASSPAAMPSANPAAPQTASLFEMLGGVPDALAQAKSMVYPLRGKCSGMMLGSMKSNELEYFLKQHGNTATPQIAAAANAARLILEERQKQSGKASVGR